MREYLNEHEEDYEPDEDTNEDDTNHSSILLGASSAVTRAELVNSVPSRLVCDRLVSQWFNSQDPGNCKLPTSFRYYKGGCTNIECIVMLHGPTFQEEVRDMSSDIK